MRNNFFHKEINSIRNPDETILSFFEFTEIPNVNLKESLLIRKEEIEKILQFSFIDTQELRRELAVINTAINQDNVSQEDYVE